MVHLLRYLLNYCKPLFEHHRFEITDSLNTENEAKIYLKNPHLAILLSQKKNQHPEITFQSLYEKPTKTWYPLHHISTLLRRPTEEKTLNDANTAFLLTHTNAIINLFSKENAPTTLTSLQNLAKTKRNETNPNSTGKKPV